MRTRDYYVYILASGRHGTLYVGVTNDLERRVSEHRNGSVPGFARRHGVCRLVFTEHYQDIETAILREKRIKKWNRDWKIKLIEKHNPEWEDLAINLLGMPRHEGQL
ncbi:MAG: GIY-YIG nuclease family protein [Pacificimonas sp.]|jgi:putative endonuclease|nr:GIY-YIG nuclease family protein [Pacificimonas sp.]